MIKPFISVIIPFHDSLQNLLDCLKSIKNQSYEAYEIIIVNNASTDISKYCHGARLYQELRPSSYLARNTGVIHAKGEILAFTDSDCIVDNYWIENGVKTCLSLKQGHYVAGEISFPDNKVTSLNHYHSLFEFDQKFYAEKLKFAATANLFVWKSDFDKVGGFPEQPVGGDAAWGALALKHGLTPVYNEKAVVFHAFREGIRSHILKVLKTFEAAWVNSNRHNFLHTKDGLAVGIGIKQSSLRMKWAFFHQRLQKISNTKVSLKIKVELLLILLLDANINLILMLVYRTEFLRKKFQNLDRHVRDRSS